MTTHIHIYTTCSEQRFSRYRHRPQKSLFKIIIISNIINMDLQSLQKIKYFLIIRISEIGVEAWPLSFLYKKQQIKHYEPQHKILLLI